MIKTLFPNFLHSSKGIAVHLNDKSLSGYRTAFCNMGYLLFRFKIGMLLYVAQMAVYSYYFLPANTIPKIFAKPEIMPEKSMSIPHEKHTSESFLVFFYHATLHKVGGMK